MFGCVLTTDNKQIWMKWMNEPATYFRVTCHWSTLFLLHHKTNMRSLTLMFALRTKPPTNSTYKQSSYLCSGTVVASPNLVFRLYLWRKSRLQQTLLIYTAHPINIQCTSLANLLTPLAAHLVTDTRKYDRGLLTLIHDQLHWLNVPQRVE